MTNTHGTTIGITVFGAVTVILAIAKLSGGVDWHWLWVLFPAWGPCAIAGAGFVGGLLQYAIRGPK